MGHAQQHIRELQDIFQDESGILHTLLITKTYVKELVRFYRGEITRLRMLEKVLVVHGDRLPLNSLGRRKFYKTTGIQLTPDTTITAPRTS